MPTAVHGGASVWRVSGVRRSALYFSVSQEPGFCRLEDFFTLHLVYKDILQMLYFQFYLQQTELLFNTERFVHVNFDASF